MWLLHRSKVLLISTLIGQAKYIRFPSKDSAPGFALFFNQYASVRKTRDQHIDGR